MTVQIFTGDCRAVMRTMAPKSVQCCVCSPPYWGLRDYKIPPSIWGGDPECVHEFADQSRKLDLRKGAGLAVLGKRMKGGGHKQSSLSSHASNFSSGFCTQCGAWRGCFGLEPTYQLYVEHTVEIFREVWRVLRDDGTLWLNMGDCYSTYRAGWTADRYKTEGWDHTFRDKPFDTFQSHDGSGGQRGKGSKHDLKKGSNRAQRGDSNDGVSYGPRWQPNRQPQPGLKFKDLAGMPWRVAFALQDDGWYLRTDIVWAKKNPMPESVYDRPTRAHEFIFLFSKSANTLLWRHDETGEWVYEKPEPQWRWRNRKTRVVVATQPRAKSWKKTWFKFNLWSGFDYYYDYAAIMEPSSPDSHARAARGRAKEHKHSNGADLSGKPHGIAIGSPVAGRLPTPAGWDEGDGHHGSVHRNGRRQQNDAVGQRRVLPAHFKQGGPNSRFHVKRVPSEKDNGRLDQHLKPSERMGRGPGWRKLAPHNGKGPRPKQNDSFDLALLSSEVVPMRNKRSVWSIATAPFKEAHFACVDAETEALTISGWKRHEELRDGEQIAAYDRVSRALVWQPATFHRYPFDGDLVAIEKRDSSQRMTTDHRCLVRRRVGGVAETTAGNLRPGMEILTTAPLWRWAQSEGPGDDFAALLGWYLTEGERRRSRIIRIHQSISANPHHVATIRDLLFRLGADFTERKRTRTWRGRPSIEVIFSVKGAIADRLEQFSSNKTINLEWLNWPRNNIRALLDAIIDGDGHRRPDGRACVIQKDRSFLDAFQVLALRLCWRTHISSRPDGGHVLYITKGDWLTLRGTDGKHTPIGTVRYKGVVWCPSVPSTFWIARRRGRTFITGNTFPPKLIEPCILAGCPKGGIVLDPFGGAGTTALVADMNGRNSIIIEINPKYAAMAEARVARARMGPEEKKRPTSNRAASSSHRRACRCSRQRNPSLVTRSPKAYQRPV